MVRYEVKFGGKCRGVRCALPLAALLLAAVGLLLGQTAKDAAQASEPAESTTVSAQPLNAEQLAVYRTVLQGWRNDGQGAVNLAVQTIPLNADGPEGDEGCVKGLDLEPIQTTASAIVHRFRPQDLAQLGSEKIVLVDADRQHREVAENDPEKTIGEGRSIEDAVHNGFAHGLVTLSEIRFDRQHKLAVVSYGFVCGSLCGNGGTAVLERVNGAWHRKSRCHDWIS